MAAVLVYQSRFEVPRPIPPRPLGIEGASYPATPLRQPRFAAAAMVATGLFLVPGAINNAAAKYPLGAEPAPQAVPLKQPSFSNAAQVATGLSWVPYAINNAAAKLPLGWEPAPQPFTTWAPRSPARAGLFPASGLSLPPQPIFTDYRYGWSVDIPDLPQFRRKQALPEWSGRLDQPAEAAAPTALWGWPSNAPDLPVPRHPAGSAAGLTLPHLAIQPFVSGSSVVASDLPQLKRALGSALAGLSLPPQTVSRLFLGHNVALPDLPYLRHPSASLAGPALAPQVVRPFVYGWAIAIPEIPNPKHPSAGSLAGLSLTLPAIPKFVYGQTVSPPDLPYRRYPGGSLAGSTLAPQIIIRPYPYGWTVALPDTPAFRRKETLPEFFGRIDPDIRIEPPRGWIVLLPELPAHPRRQALPEISGRLDQAEEGERAVPFGWDALLAHPYPRCRSQLFSGLVYAAYWMPQPPPTPPSPPIPPGALPIYIGLSPYPDFTGAPLVRRLVSPASVRLLSGLPDSRRLTTEALIADLTALDKKPS